MDYSDGETADDDNALHSSMSSSVTISLPIHVMYVVLGPSGRWQHVSVSSVLHVAFVYNNIAAVSGPIEAPESGIADKKGEEMEPEVSDSFVELES